VEVINVIEIVAGIMTSIRHDRFLT